jgi:hypothetical protein
VKFQNYPGGPLEGLGADEPSMAGEEDVHVTEGGGRRTVVRRRRTVRRRTVVGLINRPKLFLKDEG